jgi:hypothetical protein
MRTIYELRSDFALDSMQRASSGPGPLGLRDSHGLIGSSEWWANIERGALRVHELRGIVSGFWPGQWGDGPAEFELRTPDGSTARWLCNEEPRKAALTFRIGRAVEVRYVVQERKTPLDGRIETTVVLTMAVDD